MARRILQQTLGADISTVSKKSDGVDWLTSSKEEELFTVAGAASPVIRSTITSMKKHVQGGSEALAIVRAFLRAGVPLSEHGAYWIQVR